MGTDRREWQDGQIRAECMLRPAAVVVFASSASSWKNVGQNANECMLPQTARTLPSPTLRVKCLVDGVSIGRVAGRGASRGAEGPPTARTRWQNDQQFLEITHSLEE